MAKKLISYDDEKPGLGLPDVVEERLDGIYATKAEIATPPPVDDLGEITTSITLDSGSGGGIKSILLAGATQILINPSSSGGIMTLIIKQWAGGSHGMAWPENIAWQAGGEPELSTEVGHTDVITLLCVDGLNWLGFVSGTGLTLSERVIRDTFNRPNSSTLGVTNTGQLWVSTGWTIADNRLKASAGGLEGDARASIDVGEFDHLHASVRVLTGGGAGRVHFRMGVRESADFSSGYRLVWTNLENSESYIQRRVGGSGAIIGDYFSLGATVGDKIGLGVVVESGTATLRVTRNGIQVYTVTDAAPVQSGTHVSISNFAASAVASAILDDFEVTF